MSDRARIVLRLAELARIERALTATGQDWRRTRWIRVERLELKERLLVMAELHVFHDGHDWFIAANIADALALRVETYSAEGTEAFDELYQMPDSAPRRSALRRARQAGRPRYRRYEACGRVGGSRGARRAVLSGLLMTHNRKPDVLPVEGASIADALDAVDVLAEIGLHVASWRATRARDTIRSALERAAAEGEARAWIPCSERMPGTHASIWFVVDGKTYGGWRRALSMGEFMSDEDEDSAAFKASAVTHWMPLDATRPAPPKGSTP